MADLLEIIDDEEDAEFLSQLEAAEAKALSLFSSTKRRRVNQGCVDVKLEKSVEEIEEGAYTAALRGSKSLAWQKQSQVQVNKTYEPPSRAVAAGSACYKCGKEGHWAKDCGQESEPGVEKPCPCGLGSCLVLTASTERNRGRKFFRCPLRQENGGCGFFEWCDHSSGNCSTAEALSAERAWNNGGQQQSYQRPAFQEGHWAKDYDQSSTVAVEKSCACGLGSCLVLTANTERNRGRKFFRCPLRQENGGCGFFEWCDDSSGNHTYAEESAWKDGRQQQFNQRPAYPGTSDFVQSRNEYNGVTNSVGSSYVDIQKFEVTDNKGYSMKTSSSCFKCGKEGHWARECPAPPSSNLTAISGGATGKSSSPNTCFKCGQSGHWAKDCSQTLTAKPQNW